MKRFLVHYVLDGKVCSAVCEGFSERNALMRFCHDPRLAGATLISFVPLSSLSSVPKTSNRWRQRILTRFRERLAHFSPRMSALLVAEEYNTTRENVEALIMGGGDTAMANKKRTPHTTPHTISHTIPIKSSVDERIATAYSLLEYYKQIERENTDDTVKVEARSMGNDIQELIKRMVEFDKIPQ